MSKTVSDITNGFIKYLKEEKMISDLPEIIEQLKLKSDIPNTVAIVESMIKLEESDKNKIVKLLKDNLNWDKKVEFTINPKLLGGIKIILGDKILDLSLNNRLEKIYEQIK